MAKQKSVFTVRQATAEAFKAMPETFSGNNLIAMSRALMARPSCTDGNIMRRLRELRADNSKAYGYEVINADRSIYRKKVEA